MNILYVCSGNINRSAAARYISKLKYSKNHLFRSAGTSKKSVGKKMTKKMRLILEDALGIDADGHRSQNINLNLIKWADIIICFADVHVNSLYSEFDFYLRKKKVIKLWEYYTNKINRITDPGTNSDVRITLYSFKQIIVCLEKLFVELDMNQFTLFDEFNEKRKLRLEMGVRTYGDALVNKDDLVVDVEEELLDMANYSYLMYCRLKKLEAVVENKVRHNKS